MPYRNFALIERPAGLSARARKRGMWSSLAKVLLVTAPVQAVISVTELMPEPLANPDAEFIELANLSDETVSIGGYRFTVGVVMTLPSMDLAPGDRVLVAVNPAAFESVYGTGLPLIGAYTGRLNNAGETLRLEDGLGSLVSEFTWSSNRVWPVAAQGHGHSLVPVDETIGYTFLDYPGSWRASAFFGGSPGSPDPVPLNLLINEIEAHTDTDIPGRESNDSIEIINPTSAGISLAGWFLSDDGANLAQWPLPDGVLAPGSIRVYDQATGFDNPPGSGFGLSKAGETLYLSHITSTETDRIGDAIRFPASENHTTYARIPDSSPWLAITLPTPGNPNARRTPDVTLTEVMYHPVDGAAEFVELTNFAATPVALQNPAGTWRVEDGVEFDFPASTVLQPGECVLIVPFSPLDSVALAAFDAAYGADASRRFFGPWTGLLSNRGELVSLTRPLEPDPGEPVSWVVVDDLHWFDRTPFPAAADGTGESLHRTDPGGAGNDPGVWIAVAPSPGEYNEPSADCWTLK